MKLFFDLDGTILDVSIRYYRIYVDLLRELSGETPLSKHEYWLLKQEQVPEREIVSAHHASIDMHRYLAWRQEVIESSDYLRCDMLIPGAKETIASLAATYSLLLVTLRSQPEQVHAQLEALGIRTYFKDVFALPTRTLPWEDKANAIKATVEPGDWIIGDTEADIKAGQILEMTTVGVLSGIRTRKRIETLKPDHIIGTIGELSEFLPAL